MTASDHKAVDLDILRRERGVEIGRPKKSRFSGIIVLLLLLALATLAYLFGPALWEETTLVEVARPKSSQQAVQAEGQALFQAAGWVEPDPFPATVLALARGVVAEMLVEESDLVKSGDPIAKLVSEDAQLAHRLARSELASAQARAQLMKRRAEGAAESYREAIDVTEQRQFARAKKQEAEAQLEAAKARIAELNADLTLASAELKTQEFLEKEGAAGPWQLELAQAKLAQVRAALIGAKADHKAAQAALSGTKASLQKAESHFSLRIEERTAADEAARAWDEAKAQVGIAEARLALAELTLERMVVKSPATGRVMRRFAGPGSAVGPSAEALCSIYDPKKLRIRVDLPQGQVAAARIGQKALISCDARPEKPYAGELIRIVENADIQKVTLELQVAVLDPDELLKPDMLCQVRVLSDGKVGSKKKREQAVVTIPETCLVGSDKVWVVDGESGRAKLVTVKIGGKNGDRVLVLMGINLSDKVIVDAPSGLKNGDLIEIKGGK